MGFTSIGKGQHQASEPRSEQQLGSKTVLFTDIVGSTRLKQLLGDRRAVALIQAHHRLVRETLASFPAGEEIETAGDSFLLLFEEPAAAVRFAMCLQARLRDFAAAQGHAVLDRIGIHQGEIFIRPHSGTPKVFGMHVDMTARIMSLARGGQIFMSRPVFDASRAVIRPEEIGAGAELIWLNHGAFLLKGLDELVEVCEAGEKDHAPGEAPASSGTAERQAGGDSYALFGWRPALGQVVPDTDWVLQDKLGEGGFGEVWLGAKSGSNEKRVFKFCFRSDRVRALRREITLFQLLAKRAGGHRNIVRLLDVCVEKPPVHLVEEYVDGKDLRIWYDMGGGPGEVPLATRVEIVAQAAEGLQAAHDAGILHRDIKPGNILVSSRDGLTVKLSDFGIGQLISDEALEDITRGGFTATLLSPASGQPGTHLYMAPELYSGAPGSTRSDIYALGVVLFQLIVGDFSTPVTPDWAGRVADPLLRQDLDRCFARQPSERFEGAGHLARNLRTLEQRRAALNEQDRIAAARERAAYRRGLWRSASIAAIIVALIGFLALAAWHNARQSRERLIRLNLRTGIDLWGTGDLLGSLSWLVEALTLDRNTARTEAARMRIGAVLRQAPRLIEVWAHADMVTAADLTENGQIVTACRDGTVQLWDGATGKAAGAPLHLRRSVLSVAFAHGGSRLVTTTEDGSAQLWNAASGHAIENEIVHRSTQEREQHVAAAFSPDGERLVTCGADKRVRFFDAVDGRELMPPLTHKAPLNAVAWSPAGDRLLICGAGGEAWIHDSRSGAVLHSPIQHGGNLIYGRFSPDGARVVTCGPNSARIWDVATGQPVGAPLRHDRTVLSAEFSPDGRWVVTASYDRTARIWDAATGLHLTEPLRHMHSVVEASFSPDGRFVLTSSHDGTAGLWNAGDGELVLQLKHNGFVLCSKFAPNGHQILTTSQDHLAKLWDIAGSLADAPVLRHSAQRVNGLAFSPDGKILASASEDHSAALWDPVTGTRLATVQHAGSVIFLAFSSDGQHLATASDDRTARVWEAPSGKAIGSPLPHPGAVLCLAFAPAGHQLLTGCRDGAARLWDTDTGRPLASPLQQGGPVRWVAYSPDGSKVATASDDRSARLWDSHTGQPLTPPLLHDVELRHVAFSPDGTKLVTACADNFDPYLFPARAGQIWDVRTGRRLGPPLQHGDGVLWAEFSPDGRLVVTTSEDGTARLWNTRSGQPTLPPLKHNWHVLQAGFSSDGQTLLTAGRDATARLWDVNSGDPVIPPLRHPQQNVRAALAPDNRRMATGTDAGAIYIWSLDRDDRDLAALRRWAEVLSGQRFDPLLGPKPLSPDAFLEQWNRVRESAPASLAISPRRLAAWHSLQAELCRQEQLWRGLLFHLNYLIAFDPANPQYLFDRAQTYADHGQWAEAAADLSKVVELRPDDFPAVHLQARAFEEAGRTGDAIVAYGEALALTDPNRGQDVAVRQKLFAARGALLKREQRPAEATLDELQARGVPLRPVCATPNQVDLSAFYNFSFADELHGVAGNNLVSLPIGCQPLAGVVFDLRGMVQLANSGPLEKTCPVEATGIVVNRSCRALHFLHAAAWGAVPPGTLIGEYVVHYAGGSTQTIPIRVGSDVRDWWQPAAPPPGSGLVVAWSGENKASRVELYKSTWVNPAPKTAVQTLDFRSTMSPAAPFLIAVTAEAE